jgi:hypothetical protein
VGTFKSRLASRCNLGNSTKILTPDYLDFNLVFNYDFILFNLFSILYCLQIADNLRPSPMVISFLTKLCSVIPTWKLIPSDDIVEIAFKQPEIRKQVILLLLFYFP